MYTYKYVYIYTYTYTHTHTHTHTPIHVYTCIRICIIVTSHFEQTTNLRSFLNHHVFSRDLKLWELCAGRSVSARLRAAWRS